MARASGMRAVLFLICPPLCAVEEPPGLLERFLAKIHAELKQLPDYVCTQRVERFTRGMNEGPWKQDDLLTYTVGMARGQEVYDQNVGTAAKTGVISTGQFGLMARHVFAWKAAKIGYRGESERGGRKAHEYEYDVAQDKSTYSLRMGTAGAIVAFQGSFHVDAETLDLLELEVQAYDIPEKVGLARADTKVTYSRVNVRGLDALLPSAATLTVSTTDGLERLNRARFGECRRFETESVLVAEESKPKAAEPKPSATQLAQGTVLQLQLDTSLMPKQLSQGFPITARLSKPLEDADGRVIPAGVLLRGVVSRVRLEPMPFPLYEIGFEFNRLEFDGKELHLKATMVDVENEKGLIEEASRMDPSFSRNQKPGLNMLVREVQKGQGILLWNAKQQTIPKGLKMKWRVIAEDEMATQLPIR